MNVIRSSAVCLLCLVVPFAIGCQGKGPKLAKAGGTVMYKGAPVEGATVTFAYPDKDSATGVTDEKGKFTMTRAGREGAPVGKAKVSISKVKTAYAQTKAPQDLRPSDMMKMSSASKEGIKTTSEAAKNELPDKYNNPETSGLEADVPAEGVDDLSYTLVD